MVRFEDREVVQQILEANLPDQLLGAHAGLFAAHVVSHQWVGPENHEICHKDHWTRHGTEDFLVRELRKGLNP